MGLVLEVALLPPRGRQAASGGQVEIEIVTPDRTYRLRCHSMQEAHHWISGLRQAVAAMAAPASDPAMRAREKSFRRLVQEDAFQKLDNVPYRCRCVGSAAAGAQVFSSAVRGEMSDARLRPGEIVEATGISWDTMIGECLKLERGYVKLDAMEPVRELAVAEFIAELGSGGAAPAGGGGGESGWDQRWRPSTRRESGWRSGGG